MKNNEKIFVSNDAVAYFSDLYKQSREKEFVKERIAKCVTGERRQALTVELFWRVLILTINTTQTSSGPNGPIAKWIDGNYKVKDWNWVANKTNDELRKSGEIEFSDSQIRYPEIKAKYIAVNRDFIIKNQDRLFQKIERSQIGNKADEKFIVDFLRESFTGLGLKQSRNLMQDLGRLQYQVPIDTRVRKQLEKSGINIGEGSFSNEGYYLRIQEVIWEISERIGILPCVFDAVAFSDGL